MEIKEGLHRVDGVNANVYLVIDGEELTLVDTGMPKSTEKILSYIRKINRQPSDVSRILPTNLESLQTRRLLFTKRRRILLQGGNPYPLLKASPEFHSKLFLPSSSSRLSNQT